MVSLTQRQELAAVIAGNSQLQYFQLLLEGGTVPNNSEINLGIHEQLLCKIATKNRNEFYLIATEIGRRKISSDSDWCQDDYLIFLLLLGQETFGARLGFLSSVLEVRTANVNPIPRRINEVFRAIFRQEYGIEGEYGFLKIPFLHLIGKLRIEDSDAKKALTAFSRPHLLDSFSPFFKILTMKAYDLTLSERQPDSIEGTAQLIEKLIEHGNKLSFSNWFKVLCAIPGRVIILIILGLASLVSLPVLVGVGKGFFDLYRNNSSRHRPDELPIAAVRDTGTKIFPEAAILVQSLEQPIDSPEKKSIILIIEVKPFSTATPQFVVEASHLDTPIRAGLGFLKSRMKDDHSFTIIPVTKGNGTIRAIIPEQQSGTTLLLALEIEASLEDTAESAASRLILRPSD